MWGSVELGVEVLNPLLFQLGSGAVAGFVVGYALKKIAKVLLVLLGLAFVALQYLQYTGFIEIRYDKILQSVQTLTEGFTLPAFLTANIPLTGSFIMGFGLGLKKG